MFPAGGFAQLLVHVTTNVTGTLCVELTPLVGSLSVVPVNVITALYVPVGVLVFAVNVMKSLLPPPTPGLLSDDCERLSQFEGPDP